MNPKLQYRAEDEDVKQHELSKTDVEELNPR